MNKPIIFQPAEKAGKKPYTDWIEHIDAALIFKCLVLLSIFLIAIFASFE